jgi:hypothetical protein
MAKMPETINVITLNKKVMRALFLIKASTTIAMIAIADKNVNGAVNSKS